MLHEYGSVFSWDFLCSFKYFFKVVVKSHASHSRTSFLWLFTCSTRSAFHLNHLPQFRFIHWCDGWLWWLMLCFVSSLSKWQWNEHFSQKNLRSLWEYMWWFNELAKSKNFPHTPHICAECLFLWCTFKLWALRFLIPQTLQRYERLSLIVFLRIPWVVTLT